MLRVILVLMAIIATGSVFAHSAERAREPTAKHGGITINADRYNLGLVLSGNAVSLYVYSHGNRPLHTASSSAEFIFNHAYKSELLILEPTGGNRLSASWEGPLDSITEIKILLKMFGKREVRTKFKKLSE